MGPFRMEPPGLAATKWMRILPVLMLGLGACSNGSSSNVATVASIVTDESSSTLQLTRFVNEGGEEPTIQELGSWSIDAGGIPFAIGRGSPPTGSPAPTECQGRTDLGAGDAWKCLYGPLLGLSAPTLTANGLGNGDVTVVPSYGMSGEEEYSLEVIQEFDDRATSDLAANLGFDVEPSDDAPLAQLPNGDLQGYYHDPSVTRYWWDWMKDIDGERRFSTLSLPGTHDSVCYRRGGDAVLTQSMALTEQLQSGIRAFDVRLKCSSDNKALLGFHGAWYQEINLDDILTAFTNYLNANDTEALFVRIKNEANETDADDDDRCGNTTFWAVFGTYFNNPRYPRFWRPDPDPAKNTHDPRLKDVRGKIVVLQNTGGDAYGIPFGRGGSGISYWDVQDSWHMFSIKSQWAKWAGGDHGGKHYKGVRRYLEKSAEYRRANGDDVAERVLFVNFLSGSFGAFPYFVAGGRSTNPTNASRLYTGICGSKKMFDAQWPDFHHHYYGVKQGQVSIYYMGTNEMTMQWLRNRQSRLTGIVYADFPGRDLIAEIIAACKR